MPDSLNFRQRFLKIAIAWILIMGNLCVVFAYFDSQKPNPNWNVSLGVSSVYEGLKWLRFHRANAPREPGQKQMVLLGSSNLAGWGTDYRVGTRRRGDTWGSATFTKFLEDDFQERGCNVQVSNLAVNGGRLRSQFFLFLYTLPKRPDVIMIGLSSWAFIFDGDFTHPKPMQQMNTKLIDLLQSAPVSQDLKTPILKYIETQPLPKFVERLEPSMFDQLIAMTGSFLKKTYIQVGLPPPIDAPTPEPVLREIHKMDESRRAHPSNEDLSPSPVFQEMAALFPHILPVMKSLADTYHVRLMFFIPPDSERAVDYFYDSLKKQILDSGIEIMDLRTMPMNAGVETYDGHHFTQRGNKELADEFIKKFQKQGDCL
jgi:hypothetical protein